jgi:beta-1,4-N-acetylglucosaminyltransferase
MANEVILIIYGEGGHKEEMRRLLAHLGADGQKIQFVSISSTIDIFGAVEHLICTEVRDKFMYWRNPFQYIYSGIQVIAKTIYLIKRYKISGVISTGPGIAVLPSLLLKILNKKVIFIEDWSRFHSRSLTGRVMYYIADIFYIQNIGLLRLYPKAHFSGRL